MNNPGDSIRLHKLVRATRQRVYEAWTSAEQFKAWWCCEPSITDSRVEIDPTVGGAIRVSVTMGGHTFSASGRFTELEPGRRIVFDWSWDGQPMMGEDTIVTIDLFDADNPFEDAPATEIVLTQSGLPTAQARNENQGAWMMGLRALGYYARGEDPQTAFKSRGM